MISINQTGKIPDVNVNCPVMTNWDVLCPKRSEMACANKMLAGIKPQATTI